MESGIPYKDLWRRAFGPRTRPMKTTKRYKGRFDPAVTQRNLELFNQNATQSLLLRLPTEILLHIINWVIEPQVLLIKPCEPFVWNNILRGMAPSLMYEKTPGSTYDPSFLGVLFVCRRLYWLSRLLPYDRLDFSFEGDWPMTVWLSNRELTQLEAIDKAGKKCLGTHWFFEMKLRRELCYRRSCHHHREWE
ncbi:hypothetical protein P154DRAFT_280853 [Amniculicola lignicola CBS 123094]|uniref:Uncharacterized protein n=1 Tax=Amniculicola lignicola CBS 123094 TaxID=1392246 RepID=A0A6A5W8L3_9PLEO|nr:hypothetical protein P154DRAFT_280853 [Amniculicola lignicola CBS 123094]